MATYALLGNNSLVTSRLFTELGRQGHLAYIIADTYDTAVSQLRRQEEEDHKIDFILIGEISDEPTGARNLADFARMHTDSKTKIISICADEVHHPQRQWYDFYAGDRGTVNAVDYIKKEVSAEGDRVRVPLS